MSSATSSEFVLSKLDIESCFICFYFSFFTCDLCLVKLILQKKKLKTKKINKTHLADTSLSNLYYLLATKASSFLIPLRPLHPSPPPPLPTSFREHSHLDRTTTLGSLHLTVQTLYDLRNVMLRHWSPCASHLIFAYGNRGFPQG